MVDAELLLPPEQLDAHHSAPTTDHAARAACEVLERGVRLHRDIMQSMLHCAATGGMLRRYRERYKN